MSHATYDEVWRQVQGQLTGALGLEPQQADRREQRNVLAQLYLCYCVISNYLAECVDQIVQPQKRELIRRLLEATLGRVLELKADLVEADLCEFTHLGEIYQQLAITPLDGELKVPRCFRSERREELVKRKETMDSLFEKLGFLEETVKKKLMSTQKAVLLIQTHERARQGRVRAQFMKELRTMKEKGKAQAAEGGTEDPEEAASLSLSCALRIQKVWRGYVTRRITRRRKIEEMMLIGMIPQPATAKNDHIEKAKVIEEERRVLQILRQEQYEQAKRDTRERLEKTKRGGVLEQLSDQVRGWLHEYKTNTGKLPEFTGSERSQSRLMFSRQGTDSELSKSTNMSSKESKAKKSKTSSKSKDGKTPNEEEEDEMTSKAIVSSFVPKLTSLNEEYNENWRIKDESLNPSQHHYDNIIEKQQMKLMENDLRKVVDDMMRAELQLLQDALDKDRGHKGKKPKKASKKTRRSGKKSKKKKEKDLTPDRTTESLFEELVANGIIRRYPEVYFKDFIGERSYASPAPHNKGNEPPISIGDFRQLLSEYCVIPMCSEFLHNVTPQTKSLLLVGPKGSGKDMLVHAICTEAGAVLFDLTPANIVGKYPGKSGLTMLIHLVSKVSKLLQPSFIYMDNAERPFVKKIPKTDRTDPKRLKKDLPKMVKALCPEERVMLIGVSTCPWESDQKLLVQVYQKYLMIPRPNYSTRYSVWRHCLGQFDAISWQFDYSAITKISDGYTIGPIINTVRDVITVKRMVQLRVHQLNPLELVNALCKETPVYREEQEAFLMWYSKTPMMKRRQRAVEILEEEEAELAAKMEAAK